ncbi:MAG TPA: hypothetical protein VGI96_11435 [Streptosporangiaceae bacterium]
MLPGIRADQGLVGYAVQVLVADGVQGQDLPDGGLGPRIAVLPCSSTTAGPPAGPASR